MLEINNLTKYYGNLLAVDNLSLRVNEGEIYGFVGPNGAGKSTTIRCILNLINKTSGEVLVNNKLVKEKNYLLKEEIGYLPSEINLYEDLTVQQMFDYNASFYKKKCQKRTEELVKMLNLDVTKRIEELSFGNLKKVGIILAMMHQPKLLVLDEATSALDPLVQDIFYDLLKEEKKKGTTIFYSTHNLAEIKKLCDRVGIIKNGRLIKESSVKELSESQALKVAIKSQSAEKIVKELKNNYSVDDGIYYFMYDRNINNLLAVLNNYEIEYLSITEPSIEEIFKHYYE